MHKKTKTLSLIIIFLALAWQCSKTASPEHTILERHPNGSPRKVLIQLDLNQPEQFIEISYYSNGQKESEKNYKNALPHGPWREWHRNGNLKIEKNYFLGEMDGEQNGYYLNGKPLFKALYDKGVLKKRTVWNPDGSVKSKL